MTAPGLKKTFHAIKHANGPAQHLALSITSVILAGMFSDKVAPVLLVGWVVTSVAVVLATVWLPKLYLKYTLLLDFVLSMVIGFQYLMYEEPQAVHPVYYSFGANGMREAVRPMAEMTMTSIHTVAHVMAVIWIAAWTLYLANLTHRQLLESQRFQLQ